MKRYLTLALLIVSGGCFPATIRDPVMVGRDIAVAEIPETIRAAALAATPNGQIVNASLVEVGHKPDLYIIRTKDREGKQHLVEVSPDGKKVKDCTEQQGGGYSPPAARSSKPTP